MMAATFEGLPVKSVSIENMLNQREAVTMSARESAEVKRALRYVEKGMTPYEAAKKAGVADSSVYRAMRRRNPDLPVTPPAKRRGGLDKP